MSVNTNRAEVRFYGTLNDFPGSEKKEYTVSVGFKMSPSAKDLIESLGIPHVEVYGIKAGGQTVSQCYNVRPDDQLEVFPKSYCLRTEKAAHLPLRFIANVHLGKLVRLMRLLGFNTTYKKGKEDKQIIEQAVKEHRTVLTRDLDLLKHGVLTYGYWLRSTDPDEQIQEIIHYFELEDKIDPFTRCLLCNGTLIRVKYDEVADKVPARVKRWCNEYTQCNTCQKVYWKGSHYNHLKEKVSSILACL